MRILHCFAGAKSLAAAAFLLTAIPFSCANAGMITDLGPASLPLALNSGAQVTGLSLDTGTAFRYTNGLFQDLGSLGGLPSIGAGINASGTVVGFSFTDTGTERAFQQSGLTPMVDIGTLGGTNSGANAINTAGAIVGAADVADDVTFHAFLYVGSTMSDLGTLGGSAFSRSEAFGIGDAGHVAGVSDIAGDIFSHAFLYTPGNPVLQDLGTLGTGNYSAAFGVNSSGHVVGESTIDEFDDITLNAFLYNGSTMINLGTLGGLDSAANSINNHGDVVGNSLLAGNVETAAFLYTGGILYNLNDFVVGSGWQLLTADAINDSGQIVGTGLFDNELRGFLYTPDAPVPEPASMLLFAGGLAAMGLLRARRSRA